MARFKVLIAHDGLRVGDIRVLTPSHVTAYMVKHGFWEEVAPVRANSVKVPVELVKAAASQTVAKKKSSKK